MRREAVADGLKEVDFEKVFEIVGSGYEISDVLEFSING